MAIAFDSANSNYNAGSVTSDTWAFNNAGGDFLVVFVYTNGSGGDTVTGVTYNAVSLTKANSANVASNQWVSCWYLKSPATGSNNIVVSTGSSTDIDSRAQTYSGTDTSTQPDSSNTGTSTGNLTLSTTVVNSGSWLASGVRNNSTGPMTAGAGTTVRGTPVAFSSGDSNGTVGTGSQSMAWTAGAGSSAGCIISIKAAGGGAVVRSLSSLGAGV